MKGKLNLYYDEEGDFLEINIGDYTEGYFKNLGDGIFERVDKTTEKVTGLAIMSFRKRTEGLKELQLNIPMGIELTSS